MTPSIIPIVSGIIDALLGSPEPEEREPENLSATAHIVVRKIGLMPRYMGLGLTVLTVAFDWTAVLTGGKRFRSLDRPRRQAWVNRWRRAPLGVLRDLVQFYEMMGTIVYFAQPHPSNPEGH